MRNLLDYQCAVCARVKHLCPSYYACVCVCHQKARERERDQCTGMCQCRSAMTFRMTAIYDGGCNGLKTNYRLCLCCNYRILADFNLHSFFMCSSTYRKSNNVACWSVNQDGDSYLGIPYLHRLEISENFNHLGLIRQFV